MIRIIITFGNEIPVINLIVDSRNMIKISKNIDFVKNQTNADNFLAFFIVFEWGRIWESAMDKQEVECNVKLCRN